VLQAVDIVGSMVSPVWVSPLFVLQAVDIVGSMVSPVWVSPLFVLQAVDIVGSMVTMWWYQRLMYVESRSMPVRDQSPDTSISPDQNSTSGGIISSGISWTC
jgi:hypothetical protein